MIDRMYRELTDEDIWKIAATYHAWRVDPGLRDFTFADIPGFCKPAALDGIRVQGHALTPGRYVGATATEDDGEPLHEEMTRLEAALRDQFAKSARTESEIRKSLTSLGFPLGDGEK